MKLYTNDIEDIFNKTPSLFQNVGIYIITAILLLFIVLSLIIKYPDKVIANFSLHTESPSISIVSNIDNHIEILFLKNGDVVQAKCIVGMIHNTLSYDDFCKLKNYVYNFNIDSISTITLANLGEFSNDFSKLMKSIDKYQNFEADVFFHRKKISILKLRLKEYSKLLLELEKKYLLYIDLQKINSLNYFTDSNLYKKKLISEYDKDNSRSKKILSEIETIEGSSEYIKLKLEKIRTIESIINLEENYNNEKRLIILDINENIELLKGRIKSWEELYILKSPIKGYIYYNKEVHQNSNVSKGDIICNIIPLEFSTIIGEINIPLTRAGEIKRGSKVLLKFYDYPYKEYGVLESKLDLISPIADSIYIGKINLKKEQLFTNQKKKIQIKQNMKGVAEIVTEEKSLFYRIFKPLLYSIDK